MTLQLIVMPLYILGGGSIGLINKGTFNETMKLFFKMKGVFLWEK